MSNCDYIVIQDRSSLGLPCFSLKRLLNHIISH